MVGSKTRVIIIGGGPAGLIASGQAALKGSTVTLLEKKNNPARKLRLTGNGRCNLTNSAPLDEFIAHFGRNGKFLRTVFSQFFSVDLMRFFESLGVKLIKDDRGRVYPKSDCADEIADALLNWAINCGANIVTNSQVIKILADENSVHGVQVSGKTGSLAADAVIIATGGASYPATGSSGDGYRLAESTGHTIIPIRPASVPLITESNTTLKLKGVSLDTVTIKIKIDGKSIISATGDLIFTHFGVSGPAVLSISRFCIDQLINAKQPVLSIDLTPEYDKGWLDDWLLRSFKQHGKSRIETVLKDLLPQRLASVLLLLIDIEPTKLCNQISTNERRKIKHILKEFDLKIIGHRPLAEAMVTAGGVNLKEVDPKTMESRIINGLYFAGEVLDFDADTGGFNLQAAFSTGWLAGRMSARH